MRVGLDVGGTKTDAVAIDDAGTVVSRVRLATGWGADAVVATVFEAVQALREQMDAASPEFRSVGIGIPGQVVPGTTRVTHAVNLGVDELDLAAAVSPTLGVPVHVENDVKAASLGGYALHGATGTMGYLNLGTGIAAGIVEDGVLMRGRHGTAGEIGHISVDPNGPLCRCGQRGCIEALAGGRSIAERWGRVSAFPVLDVFDAADAGDLLAAELRNGLAAGAAAAVRVLVLTVDVDTVVIGGGVTNLGARLMRDIAADLDASATASPFMRSLSLSARVSLLPAGSPAAALGAALLGEARNTEGVLAHG
ncbi:ROK family protein [Microbacterium sp. NPDC076911]|uniref:ROK family protein n=1 Tax=Microbacterium sp. NPDC076911 TaxID=3154958 RepID=UPI003421D575